ncbi:MAG: ACT domain-containing protein [Candidatus Micrarchaeota archaeon]
MASTAELTEKYVSEHPSVRDCLKNGVINYSKLSRRIARELGIGKKTSLEAILIACRRTADKLAKDETAEEKVVAILKKSELEIKNKMVAFILDRRVYAEALADVEKKIRRTGDVFYAIEGKSAFTVIVSERHSEEVKRVFERETIKTTRGLAMVTIKSPEDLENTPGVVAFIYSLLGEHGINVVETMSCWTDTIILVAEKDVPAVMKLFDF